MAADVAIDFKALFDAAPTPLMVLSPNFTIVEVNDLYTSTVGRCRDTLVGRDMFEAFPGDEASEGQLRRSLDRVVASGQVDLLPLLHYPLTPSHGTGPVDRFWSCSHVPIRDAAGKLAFILHQTQDVTALHREGAALSSAEEIATNVLGRAERVQALNVSLLAESAQLRNLFMRSPSFMCLLKEPDYRFELVNPAFTAATVELAIRHLPARPTRLIVAGGGRHNATMMAMLADACTMPVVPIETLGANGDATEAEGFAYMAVRSLAGLPISFPGTTGAPVPLTGGRLSRP